MSSAVPFFPDNFPEAIRFARNAPSADAIRNQLSRIFKSAAFIHAEKMRRFLEFVVEQTLAGRSNKLCEYSIGMSVFGRKESFEPGIDPIVRNAASRLRQKLLEYYGQSRSEEDDEVVIDMPKGGYVPVFRHRRPSSAGAPQYRLTIILTRIKDNAEIWATHHEY